MDACLGVEQRLRQLDRLREDLREVDQSLAHASVGEERLRHLVTITGVNATVTIGLLSAIRAGGRFPNVEKLLSSFRLNPSVYQSGPTPAGHGNISRRGCSYARVLLVEAASNAA